MHMQTQLVAQCTNEVVGNEILKGIKLQKLWQVLLSHDYMPITGSEHTLRLMSDNEDKKSAWY